MNSIVQSSPRSLKVAVRSDASDLIGTGHIFRSFAIFDELRNHGAEITFFCRDTPGNLIELVAKKGFRVCVLANVADQLSDAAAFRAAAEGFSPFDVIWVDHYALDCAWERRVSDLAGRLCVMDDLADRVHDCHLLVDSSHEPGDAALYAGLVPSSTPLLLGREYVPLRSEFYGSPQPRRALVDNPRHLLVTLGGNDPLNATSLVVAALNHADFEHLSVAITLGLSNPRSAEVILQAKNMENVAIHMQHERPSDLMREADLCIGAGGTTSWERCYMGLPTLGLILAENQVELMRKLATMNVARNLGWADKLSVADLRDALSAALADAQWRKTAAMAGQDLIDGKGVERIVNELLQGGAR